MNSPKCPIVIPTYKNRPNNLVQHLEDVSDNQIYVFCYKDDYENYKQYDCKKNVIFVQLDVPWRSIQKKRVVIQNYFIQRPDIERYILIDDDVTKCRMLHDDGKVRNIPLKDALVKLEELHCKYCHTFSGGENFGTIMAHATNDCVINKRMFYQVFCFENKWVIEHPECRFKDLQNICEDVAIFFDCLRNEQDFVCFSKLNFIENVRKENYHIASSQYNTIRNRINTLRYFKEYAKMRLSAVDTRNFGKLFFLVTFDVNLKTNERFSTIHKPILDRYMPGWEDLNNDYDQATFEKVFDEIAKEELKVFKIPKRKSYEIFKKYL